MVGSMSLQGKQSEGWMGSVRHEDTSVQEDEDYEEFIIFISTFHESTFFYEQGGIRLISKEETIGDQKVL